MIGKMIAINAKTIQGIGGALWILLFYGLFFWRTFKSNPGNRVVECGSMTLIVFFALLALTQLGSPPDWLFSLWLILLVLLCFSTQFFVMQRVYRAIQRRHSKQIPS
ncbi:MAG: hypothetical protein WA802_00625 [Terracidiphilus sp.]